MTDSYLYFMLRSNRSVFSHEKKCSKKNKQLFTFLRKAFKNCVYQL